LPYMEAADVGKVGRAVLVAPDEVLVRVRVRPRSRPGWKIAGDDVVVSVAAAPVDGAATEEARRALARVIGTAPSRVSVHSGKRARLKVFAVSAVDPHVISAALETAVGDQPEARGPR
jgi:uncharacterized protein YggU (UPF0235/DUF167 family)